MQKYEKLEKIGEGNGATKCSYTIFCIPCISSSSTISNAQTPTSTLAASLAPSFTLRADNNPPVSISCRRPLATLALPVAPISRPQHFLHFLRPASEPLKESPPPPPPASVLAADLQPQYFCRPSFLSQTPAHYFQTLPKHCLCYRPPTLAATASPCCRHVEPQQAPSLPRPHSQSSAMSGLHPESLPLFLQASEIHSRDSRLPSREGLPRMPHPFPHP